MIDGRPDGSQEAGSARERAGLDVFMFASRTRVCFVTTAKGAQEGSLESECRRGSSKAALVSDRERTGAGVSAVVGPRCVAARTLAGGVLVEKPGCPSTSENGYGRSSSGSLEILQPLPVVPGPASSGSATLEAIDAQDVEGDQLEAGAGACTVLRAKTRPDSDAVWACMFLPRAEAEEAETEKARWRRDESESESGSVMRKPSSA